MSQSSFAGFPMPRPDKGGTNTGDANAQPADILTGFSGYAKGVKVVGTMPNNGSPTLQPGQSITPGYYSGGAVSGTQFASGTVTSGAVGTAVNFTQDDNSTVAGKPSVVVSGLTFTPSKIILVEAATNAVGDITVYDASDIISGSVGRIVCAYNFQTGKTPQVLPIALDGTAAYANSSGFRMPVNTYSTQYKFYVYGS